MALCILLLAACSTTYKVSVGDSTFESRSYRDFKYIDIKYKEFELRASGVTDDTAEVAGKISGDITEAVEDWLMGRPSSSLGNPAPISPTPENIME